MTKKELLELLAEIDSDAEIVISSYIEEHGKFMDGPIEGIKETFFNGKHIVRITEPGYEQHEKYKNAAKIDEKYRNFKQIEHAKEDKKIKINTFENKTLEKREDEVYAILQSIFEERNWCNAYYAGGTLCYDYKEDDKVHVMIFNFSDNLPSRLRLLLAKIYIKYKTDKGSHWKEAKEIWGKALLEEDKWETK